MVKKRVHTTVSHETAMKIEDLKKEFKTVSNVIKKAVECLYNSSRAEDLSEEDLILLDFIKNLNFTICAKDHYTALVEGDAERAVKESMVEMAVKFLSKKPISDLSLEELLKNVSKLWKILNRAEHVEVGRTKGGLNFVFYHDMRSMKVSELHLRLIEYLYEKYYAKQYEMKMDTLTVNGFSVVFTRKLHF